MEKPETPVETPEILTLSAAEAVLLADRVNQGRALLQQAQANSNNLLAGAVRSIFESHGIGEGEMPTNVRDLSIQVDPQGAPTAIQWIKPKPKAEEPAEVAAVGAPANGGEGPSSPDLTLKRGGKRRQ